MRQILAHLLDNAVKFTREGYVQLVVDTVEQNETGYKIRFEIEDSGIGFDEEDLPRLFEPFTQADQSSTRAYGGTGLGLAVTKRLVTLMNGTIEGKSEGRTGSVFILTLPLAREAM